ncbi:hypothetical protein GCM10017788_14500 [Amycolatopsis acidiphila]|nr:hypothetical protein GCM10017788_14500 [Amycolatopsis acidiphila]
MRPSADAPARILTGARRARRRRTALTATGGVLSAVVLVGAGLVLGQLRSTHTDTAAPVLQPTVSDTASSAPLTPAPLVPPPGSPSSGEASGSVGQSSPSQTAGRASPPPAAPPSSATRSLNIPLVSGPVLGPNGYSKLVLGMSFADAKQTGLLAGADTPPTGCADYTLTEGTAGVRNVTISDTLGIVSFEASGAHTPERIRVGSTKDELEAAYPALGKSGGGYSAAAGSGSSYLFMVDDRNRVASLLLVGPATC